MKNTEIEIIYTFEGKEQKIQRLDFFPDIIANEKSLFRYITGQLSAEEKMMLVKLSCCVYWYDKDVKLPKWYHECNGKFYLAKIMKLLKPVWNLQTMVDASTIKMLTE